MEGQSRGPRRESETAPTARETGEMPSPFAFMLETITADTRLDNPIDVYDLIVELLRIELYHAADSQPLI